VRTSPLPNDHVGRMAALGAPSFRQRRSVSSTRRNRVAVSCVSHIAPPYPSTIAIRSPVTPIHHNAREAAAATHVSLGYYHKRPFRPLIYPIRKQPPPADNPTTSGPCAAVHAAGTSLPYPLATPRAPSIHPDRSLEVYHSARAIHLTLLLTFAMYHFTPDPVSS